MGKLIGVLVKTVFWLAMIGELAHVTELMQKEAFSVSRGGLLSLSNLNRGLYPASK